MNPTISVIIPSYNQGKFIERTLRSVLDQNVAALECIVYDGGSKDETLSILRRYEDHVRWFSEPDHGQSHAVNKGIAVSKGEIIAWINSDDIYYSGALAKVQRFFAENDDVDVIYGNAFHIDVNDAQIEPYYTEPWNFERLKEVCYLCQPAVFFRRRVVEQFGNLDESLKFCMDYEFWLRLAKGGAFFTYMPVVLAGSRLYSGNKTIANRVAVHAEINCMLARLLGKTPVVWIYNYAQIVADEKKAAHAKWKYPLSFSFCLFISALRWNHGFSKALLQKYALWITAELKNYFGWRLTSTHKPKNT